MLSSKSESQQEQLKNKLEKILKYIVNDGNPANKINPKELDKIINQELGLDNNSSDSYAILNQKMDYAHKLLHIYETGKNYKDIKRLYEEEKEKQSDADKKARRLNLIGVGVAVVALTLFVLAIVSGFLPVNFAFAENSLLGPIIFGFSSGIATYTSGAAFSYSANIEASAKGSKIDRIYDECKSNKQISNRIMGIDKSGDDDKETRNIPDNFPERPGFDEAHSAGLGSFLPPVNTSQLPPPFSGLSDSFLPRITTGPQQDTSSLPLGSGLPSRPSEPGFDQDPLGPRSYTGPRPSDLEHIEGFFREPHPQGRPAVLNQRDPDAFPSLAPGSRPFDVEHRQAVGESYSQGQRPDSSLLQPIPRSNPMRSNQMGSIGPTRIRGKGGLQPKI